MSARASPPFLSCPIISRMSRLTPPTQACLVPHFRSSTTPARSASLSGPHCRTTPAVAFYVSLERRGVTKNCGHALLSTSILPARAKSPCGHLDVKDDETMSVEAIAILFATHGILFDKICSRSWPRPSRGSACFVEWVYAIQHGPSRIGLCLLLCSHMCQYLHVQETRMTLTCPSDNQRC